MYEILQILSTTAFEQIGLQELFVRNDLQDSGVNPSHECVYIKKTEQIAPPFLLINSSNEVIQVYFQKFQKVVLRLF